MSEKLYTQEQEKLTLSILEKDKQAFYELLQVDEKASDNEIKKAYRKLAIRLHPDKNSHPRASEAFKRINRAFEVLNDEQKRQMFDQLGRDPDDRAAAAARDPFSGNSSGFQGASGFSPEGMFFRRAASGPPEDIFDFLFNAHAAGGGHPFNRPFGGPFDGPFGRGPTFSFGGPSGFKVYTNGQGARRPRQNTNRQQEQTEDQEQMQQVARILIPILLILFLPMLERLLFGA